LQQINLDIVKTKWLPRIPMIAQVQSRTLILHFECAAMVPPQKIPKNLTSKKHTLWDKTSGREDTHV